MRGPRPQPGIERLPRRRVRLVVLQLDAPADGLVQHRPIHRALRAVLRTRAWRPWRHARPIKPHRPADSSAATPAPDNAPPSPPTFPPAAQSAGTYAPPSAPTETPRAPPASTGPASAPPAPATPESTAAILLTANGSADKFATPPDNCARSPAAANGPPANGSRWCAGKPAARAAQCQKGRWSLPTAGARTCPAPDPPRDAHRPASAAASRAARNDGRGTASRCRRRDWR
ncbi:hypothetical protein G6F65_019774 [Rhizopus arrhizus]|nr:hypothetical protein G6F65_019774 [Rhizopus arrhizus]